MKPRNDISYWLERNPDMHLCGLAKNLKKVCFLQLFLYQFEKRFVLLKAIFLKVSGINFVTGFVLFVPVCVKLVTIFFHLTGFFLFSVFVSCDGFDRNGRASLAGGIEETTCLSQFIVLDLC